MNLISVFKPTNDKFYRLFEDAAQNNIDAAKELHNLCLDFKDPEKTAKKIHQLEHIGDEITHNIYYQLNRVFVTPIDREDINSLTQNLDDVVDVIYKASYRMSVYNIKKPDQVCISLSELILDSTKIIAKTLPFLRSRANFKKIMAAIIEINKLENKADDQLRFGLKQLFKNSKDALKVIKFKDIYETMEEVTDKTEDISNVLSDLVTKYG